ncbi:MAG TPA: hypothetical protein VF229_04920 [Burkholderiaceae bacterium]
MLGQQITVRAAAKLAGRLVAAFGEPLQAADGGLTHTFPTPRTIAGADLRSLGMPSARAAALSSLAAAVAADRHLLSPAGSLDEAIARLRALREPDAFPAADVGLTRAVARSNGSRPSAAELIARAEPWRPWRAYAAQHLWAADADAKRTSPRQPSHQHLRGASRPHHEQFHRGPRHPDE